MPALALDDDKRDAFVRHSRRAPPRSGPIGEELGDLPVRWISDRSEDIARIHGTCHKQMTVAAKPEMEHLQRIGVVPVPARIKTSPSASTPNSSAGSS